MYQDNQSILPCFWDLYIYMVMLAAYISSSINIFFALFISLSIDI